MPIWLRKFTFNKINDYYKKEKEEYENISNNDSKSTLVDSSGNINKEAFKAASPKVTPGPKSKVKYK